MIPILSAKYKEGHGFLHALPSLQAVYADGDSACARHGIGKDPADFMEIAGCGLDHRIELYQQASMDAPRCRLKTI